MSGLSLMAYEPLIASQGLYSREFVQDLTPVHQGWSHVVSAVGGFDSAGFTLKLTRPELDDWFDDGLMRHVVLYNPEAIPVWEGFVNRLRYTVGTLQKTKSVDTMFNEIWMKYSPLDTSVSPPIEMAPVALVVADLASQATYGTKATVISGGGRTDQAAYDWARTVLRFRAEPQVGESVNTVGGGEASMDVECLGYYHTLKWLPYLSTANCHSIQAHQLVQEVLDFYHAVNPYPSLDFSWMDYNFKTLPRCFDQLPSCWDVIGGSQGILSQGGAGGERWVGGFYQDRRFIYKAAEDEQGLYGGEGDLDLFRSLSDPSQRIYDAATGTEVKPWDMVPDRILKTVDLNVGGDESLMYIEQTTFTEPYGLQLVGGDDERLAVYLAQRGLSSL